MNDRDIEDTRQPREQSQYSPCDKCGADRDTNDLTYVHDLDYWMCEDCYTDYTEEQNA